MNEPGSLWECQRVIPDVPAIGRRAIDEILEQLARQRWSPRDVFAVHVALEESLINAIRHGNQGDPDKHVHLFCRITRDRVHIEVLNEGEGFDPQSVPDPTKPDRLELPGGRGLLLIRTFMTRVEFQDSGRRMILEMDRDGHRHRASRAKTRPAN